MDSEVLTARAPADLAAVSARLHDQVLVLDRVRLDRGGSRLAIPILVRHLAAKSLVRSRLFHREYLIPLFGYTLTVENLREFLVREDQGIRFYCLDRVIWRSPATLLLTTGEGTSLIMSVSSISVLLSGLDEIVGHQHLQQGMLGQRLGRVDFV